eukprot:TRINITY_DN4118_c0_g2_i1.p1 TRINITY_DN4118_c0_g2~~TRINITY_DN4118_c0_g2_i1.p1  ORF type:complete len:459 (+),score=123.17 TRINITY_DN4118_c0_g2_i1:116-1492(+)
MESTTVLSSFFTSALEVNRRFREGVYKTRPVPLQTVEYFIEGDEFLKKLWKAIDEAKSYVWLQTYTMDNSTVANITLHKLTEAKKRGAHVMLIVDDLNNTLDRQMQRRFVNSGATFHALNRCYKMWRIFVKRQIFQRHHEKIAIADDTLFIGSSNIAKEYGSYKYGDSSFWDMNLMIQNTCLESARRYIIDVLEMNHGLRAHPIKSNEELLAEYDKVHPDSPFRLLKSRLIRTNQPFRHEIQENVLKIIEEAKTSLRIIQPYYNPIKKVENALIAAAQRGVQVEVITAGKRDQPCYSNLINARLMTRLLKAGISVYEHPDRFLHMKAYLADDKVFTVGSFNNDKWSWNINHELNILIENEEEGQKLRDIYYHVKTFTRPVKESGPISFFREAKLVFWDIFLGISEWCSNQKRYEKAERRLKAMQEKIEMYQEVQQEYVKKYRYNNVHNEWDDSFGKDF